MSLCPEHISALATAAGAVPCDLANRPSSSAQYRRVFDEHERRLIGEACVDLAASIFAIPRGAMTGRRRTYKFTFPRFAVCGVAAEEGLSSTEIGRLLGNREHSTILHGIRRFEVLCEFDAGFRTKVAELRTGLRLIKSGLSNTDTAFLLLRRQQALANLQKAIAELSRVHPGLGEQMARALTDNLERQTEHAHSGLGPNKPERGDPAQPIFPARP